MNGFGSFPIYQGRRYQQSGAGFFSAALPFLRNLATRTLKTAARSALKAAPEALSSVLNNQASVKDAGLGFLKNVGMSTARGVVGLEPRSTQKRRNTTSSSSAPRAKRRKKKKNIGGAATSGATRKKKKRKKKQKKRTKKQLISGVESVKGRKTSSPKNP